MLNIKNIKKDITKMDLSSHLYLNEGAYFFQNADRDLSKSMINELFDKITEGTKVLERRIKIEENTLLFFPKVHYSLLVFTYEVEPTFIVFNQNRTPKELKEKKMGFFLLIEIDKYVVIIRKNTSHISTFIKQLQPISGDRLGGILISGKTLFKKVRLNNMSITANAMRNKSFEAEDLETSMPMFNANNSIVSTVRFDDQQNGACTLCVSTSRISKFGKKTNLHDTLMWIDTIVNALNNYKPTDTFLNRFALPASWEKEKKNLTPVSLLINKQELLNAISNNPTLYKIVNAQKVPLSDTEQKHLMNIIANTFSLVKNSPIDYVCKHMSTLHISVHKVGISLKVSDYLNNILYQKENGTYDKLINLINNLSCFTISFDKYQYVFSGRRLYKNNHLNKDIDAIDSILEVWPELNLSVSEKGDNYHDFDEKFQNNCVFGIVENKISDNVNYLICDDLGNEWADYIAITGNKISFIHSKSNNSIGKTSLSASKFQDVVGQALKNIGYLNPSDDFLDKKELSINSTYRINYQITSIQRVRKGTAHEFVNKIKQMRVSPNQTREICLAVDFLSKKELNDAFKKLIHDQPFIQKNSTIQLLWLLNAFISTCKDADLHCRIFCCT